MNEWISVEDNMPEYNSRILVYDSFFKDTFSAHYIGDSDYMKVVFKERGLVFRNVTHWMPLPDKPNTGGE